VERTVHKYWKLFGQEKEEGCFLNNMNIKGGEWEQRFI